MRTSFRVASATLALAAGAAGAGLTAAALPATAATAPQNVIYLLGDGMGRTHVTAGRERFYGADGKLAMEKLPVVGQVATYAVEKKSGQPGASDFVPNLVTDSASSATAWSSGVKTYNAALGIDAKGAITPTLMEMAHQSGMATGNVSTAEVTDATPAGQMTHLLARGCQGPTYSAGSCQDATITGTALDPSDIRVTPAADQIARNQTADVIFGGGAARFEKSDEDALKANGYTVLGSFQTLGGAAGTLPTKDDLAATTASKVVGLFNNGNLTVEKYKQANPDSAQAKEPTVAAMTAKAIDLLEAKSATTGKGFYLQVEGALIDKRSHANDAAQTLEEIKAFDDAVKVAYDFAKADGHTTVIVTADHECAGFNIIEKGSFTNAEAAAPPTNNDSGNPANTSTLARTSGNTKDAARSLGIFNAPGATAANNFAPATFGTADQGADYKSLDGTAGAQLWLTYLSGNHTGADVPIFAYGKGSEEISAEIDNTDLFGIMGRAAGLMAPLPGGGDTGTTTKTAVSIGFSAPARFKATQRVTLKAQLQPAAPGVVVFHDGQTVIGSAPVVDGTATLRKKFAKGRHTLWASYDGNATFSPATSPTVTVRATR